MMKKKIGLLYPDLIFTAKNQNVPHNLRITESEPVCINEIEGQLVAAEVYYKRRRTRRHQSGRFHHSWNFCCYYIAQVGQQKLARFLALVTMMVTKVVHGN